MFDPTFERYIGLRSYALAKLAGMRAARDAINIPLLSRSVSQAMSVSPTNLSHNRHKTRVPPANFDSCSTLATSELGRKLLQLGACSWWGGNCLSTRETGGLSMVGGSISPGRVKR